MLRRIFRQTVADQRVVTTSPVRDTRQQRADEDDGEDDE